MLNFSLLNCSSQLFFSQALALELHCKHASENYRFSSRICFGAVAQENTNTLHSGSSEPWYCFHIFGRSICDAMTATQVSGLITSAVINIALTVLFFALYSVFRKQPAYTNIYFARNILKENRKGAQKANFSLENFIPSAGWVMKAWRLSEEEILESAGLDAVVFLRIFVFSIRFFAICTFVGIFILVPVNYIQGEIDIDTIKSDALDKFTISNISVGSNRIWVHFCALYCISIIAYVFLYLEYQNVTRKRIAFLQNVRPQLDQFTILVRAIPKSDQQTYSEQAEEFFSTYHPSTYLLHHIVYEDGKLQILMRESERLLREVETLKSKPAVERAPRRTGFLGLFGGKADPVDACVNKLEELQRNIKESQSQFLRAKRELPAAFVSFKTRWGASVAAQTQQTPNPLQWITEWAPESRDVHWHSLSIPFSQLWMRRLIVGVAFFFVTILYFIPAGLVYTLASLDNLTKWFPFVENVLSIPAVSSIITGYLPSLLITILFSFIPPVLLFLTKREGYVSISSQERKTCGKFFLFLIGNSFFLVTYGSLVSLITESIESPGQIPSRLASAVSGQANFFMNYIMTKGWTGFATEILQLDVLFKIFFLKHFVRKQMDGPYVQSLKYYRAVPTVLFFIFIGFMYTILAPLVLPLLMVFFILGYIIFRNQILNLYDPAYDTGGQYWPHVHNRVVASIFMMQLTCIGMFGLKSKALASSLTIPLPILTLLINHYCNLRFYPVFRDLSVQITMLKDMEDERSGLKEEMLQALQKAYLCPTLQPVDINTHGSSASEPLLSSRQYSLA